MRDKYIREITKAVDEVNEAAKILDKNHDLFNSSTDLADKDMKRLELSVEQLLCKIKKARENK